MQSYFKGMFFLIYFRELQRSFLKDLCHIYVKKFQRISMAFNVNEVRIHQDILILLVKSTYLLKTNTEDFFLKDTKIRKLNFFIFFFSNVTGRTKTEDLCFTLEQNLFSIFIHVQFHEIKLSSKSLKVFQKKYAKSQVDG